MHPDLHYLIQLQDLDSTAERARRRIAEMPSVLDALDARRAEGQAAVDAVKQRMAVSQAARREIEKDLAAVQSRLSKFKGQLMEVKTNKEYQAMQKEISVAEHDVRAHEDRLLERMEEAETHAAELKRAEAELKTILAEVARERQTLDADRKALDLELTRVTEARSQVVANLSREALVIFERVAHGRKGLAMAEARDGLCTVCHVRLRPQAFNDVRRNDTLIQCESCTRILYFVAPATAPNVSEGQ